MSAPSSLTIRAISDAPEDGRRWLELRRLLWPDCPAARHRLEMEILRREGNLILLAMLGEEAVGFAEVSIRNDHVVGTESSPVPYLEGWYVTPRHREEGVGKRLLGEVETWARKQGFTELASDAELADTSAIETHLHLGFREVGRQVCLLKNL